MDEDLVFLASGLADRDVICVNRNWNKVRDARIGTGRVNYVDALRRLSFKHRYCLDSEFLCVVAVPQCQIPELRVVSFQFRCGGARRQDFRKVNKPIGFL